MCGIVGAISKNGTFWSYMQDVFTEMLKMDSIRGPDSTGCFGISMSGHVDHIKGNADGYLFTRSKQYQDFERRIPSAYRVVIGHNRKATIGKITAANAHPFQQKHIIMVHNGSIRNKDALNKEVEVDSHAIAHSLSEHDPVTALSKIDGAYALVWYDQSDKTLNLARNAERPLFLLEFAQSWIISSEPGLPLWLMGRDNRKMDRCILVPTEKILVFNLDRIEKGFVEVPYEEYKAYVAPKQPYKFSHTGGSTKAVSQNDAGSLLTIPDRGGDKVVDLTARKKSIAEIGFKAGDVVLFKMHDSQPDNGAEVVLGHPVFGTEMDQNIYIRTVLPKGESPYPYMGMDDPKHPNQTVYYNDYWRGIVQHVRNLAGIPTLYVHKIEPYEEIKNVQGELLDKVDANEAIKGGCGRCSKVVVEADIPTSIIRRKGDGTWRVVCPACLKESMEQAEANSKGQPLRARTH